MLVIAASLLWCFKSGIFSLFEAWQKPEYSHGYLIPVIAVFIALLRSRDMPTLVKRPLLGTGAVVFGLAVGAFGTLAAIPDVITYGLIAVIVGLIANGSGTNGALRLWPAWAYLAFMLPLPNFIYWPLSIKLQFLSSEIGVGLIKLMGIPVFLDGNIIDLGVYKLQVAEACSGLRYLFPLMSFGFLVAIFYAGNWWQKLLLFLSTIPITIGMNSLRIAVIGALVNSYGIKQAEGFLHFFEGWVVFIVCLALLYIEAVVLKRLSKSAGQTSSLFAIDFEGFKTDLARWLKFRASKALVVSAGVMLLSSIAWSFGTNMEPAKLDRLRFDVFPMTKDNWIGKRISLEPDIERVLGADDYFFADFASASEKQSVNLLVSYYNSQTSGSGIHSPAVCIPGGGWEVSRWEQAKLEHNKQSFAVNRAIIQKGQYRQLVYYWFEQRGRRLTSDYVAKAYTLWDSATRGRSDGALVRVVTSIEGKDVAGAEDRLNRFVKFTLSEIPRFVPE